MINQDRWDDLRAEHTGKYRYRIDLFYIQPDAGNGDLLYNTCREIIDKNEQDEWAHWALESVFDCLEKGIRWPDHMVKYIPAAAYRRQDDMTQDPWIMAYCCAVHLNRIDLIRRYRPNNKIFNLPDKWAWRKALLGKRNAYWLWRIITPYRLMQWFVYVFYGYMDKAYLDQIKTRN